MLLFWLVVCFGGWLVSWLTNQNVCMNWCHKNDEKWWQWQCGQKTREPWFSCSLCACCQENFLVSKFLFSFFFFVVKKCFLTMKFLLFNYDSKRQLSNLSFLKAKHDYNHIKIGWKFLSYTKAKIGSIFRILHPNFFHQKSYALRFPVMDFNTN